MKYVKTFENFAQGMEEESPAQAQGENKFDLDSPEVQDSLAKLAKEEGADVNLVLQTAKELAKEPVKYNEEEDPFPTLMEWGQVGLGVVAFVAGCFGLAKLTSNVKMKRYIQYKAEEEVKAAIKADPTLVDKGYDTLIKATYDRLKADKEFVDTVMKQSGGYPNVPGTARYRGFSATAGQL
jgi:hypothetical protein